MRPVPNVVVQPLETSVVREIHVKTGDLVSRGQSLATLDPTFSQADVDQLRTRVVALEATINRLNAELNGQNFIAADSKNPDEVLQGKLFLQRKAYYETSLRNYDAQIASAQANLKTSQDEEVMLQQRLETLRSIETMRGTLMDKEVGSKLNFLLSRDARLDVDGSLSRLRGNQVDYAHRIEKAAGRTTGCLSKIFAVPPIRNSSIRWRREIARRKISRRLNCADS